MLKSSFYDCSDTYILVSGTITVAPQAGNNPNNIDKKDIPKDIDAVMLMHILRRI